MTHDTKTGGTPESLPEHIDRPHLRPLQPVPVRNQQGQAFVALRDPAQLSEKTMVVPATHMMILQQFQGERSLDEIAAHTRAPLQHIRDLAKGLDGLGLLWGPTFEELESKLKERLESSGAFAVGASGMMGKSAEECRAAIDEHLSNTEDPEVEGEPRAILAPHLDYDRGWPNYAAAYHTLRQVERPDRVVILGTNHFGIGDGVVLTEYGFDTPMGRCPADRAVVDKLVERMGRPVIVDQLDHVAEHSIQLHLPWLQYWYPDIPVVAALMPDPLAPMVEDDDERISGEAFADTLQDVLGTVGGRTLYVASCDLSHVGPQFGEPRPVDDQRKVEVERHDRDMMAKFIAGDVEEFLAAMKWSSNPTRWCSVGTMAATLRLIKPQQIELLDYRQACDEKGFGLVSSAAMAIL
jgi:AmmeMemoRadiSam system protein B